ncbi:RtcB family protein [Paenibacillus sp. FSL R10-2734]|uniref:RtcB family protein n=1 Tax=Paenibacillus sp. FSL R10-2734 TaxID=2954691 RepID=UPI0030DC09D3
MDRLSTSQRYNFLSKSNSTNFYYERIKEFVYNLSESSNIVLPIDVYPDAYLKSWGFPSGIKLVSEKNGLIFPAAVPDIGCGFRIIKTNLFKSNIGKTTAENILELLEVYAGKLSQSRFDRVKGLDINKILEEGVHYLIKLGIGNETDLMRMRKSNNTSEACLLISDSEKEELKKYFGVCAGHFLEIRIVEEILEPEISNELQLSKDQLIIIIHAGAMSGKTILLENYYYSAVDFVIQNRLFEVEKVEKGLFGIPINSEAGLQYLQAASALINYSHASRHYAHYLIEELFKEYVHTDSKFELISDICHSKVEVIENEKVLHARGLQTLYPSQHINTLSPFKKSGDIGLLAGEKGTNSHLVAVNPKIKSMDYQCSHGTGKYLNHTRINDLPNKVVKKALNCFFDTHYDIINDLPKDFFSTNETLDILQNKYKLITPCLSLAPFINFWGEKDQYR